MPIYEFACKNCGHEFDKLCKIDFKLEDIKCDQCGSREVEKKLSLFGCKGSSSSGGESSCGGCSSHNCSSCGS